MVKTEILIVVFLILIVVFTRIDFSSLDIAAVFDPPIQYFFDDFGTTSSSSFSSKWIEENEFDWLIGTPAVTNIPGYPPGNRVARAVACTTPIGCILRTTSLDTSLFDAVDISFWKRVSTTIDVGEGLQIQYFDGSAWNQLAYYTDQSGENNTWTQSKFQITQGLSSNFMVRFISKQSQSSEYIEIDDVLIEVMTEATTTTSTSTTSTTLPPTTTTTTLPPPTSPTSLILDDGDLGFTTSGSWQTAVLSCGYGNDYRYETTSAILDTARWTPNILGNYEIFVHWCAHSVRPDNTRYTINYADGSAQVFVNQKLNANLQAVPDFTASGFKSIGVYNLNGNSYIELDTSSSGDNSADAVKFVAYVPTTTTTIPLSQPVQSNPLSALISAINNILKQVFG